MTQRLFNESDLSPEGLEFYVKRGQEITDLIAKFCEDLAAQPDFPPVERGFIVQSLGLDLMQMAAQIFFFQGNASADPVAAQVCRRILQHKMGEMFDVVVAANTPANTTAH